MKEFLHSWPAVYRFAALIARRLRALRHGIRWGRLRAMQRSGWLGRSIANKPPRPGGSVHRQAPSLATAANAAGMIGIGNAAVGRHIVMLVVSDLRIDPRVEREARALVAAGYAVSVICPEPFQGAAATVRVDWGAGIVITWLHRSGADFVNYRPGYLADALYGEAVKSRPFAFHAHDLNTGYAALAAARWTGAHLVVDFHEWFSENVHWNTAKAAWVPYDPNWRADLRALEARCLREASHAVTVCDFIADAMSAELGGRRAEVVRNIPSLSTTPSRTYSPLKAELGLPASCFLLLWQGGTGPTRLIEPIIEALAASPRCVFVIRGPSLDLYGPAYLELARKIGVEKRLILLPPVPSGDVVAAARSADAGIWTLPALCRNFTLALPNKLFEYLAAGLPILAADYPEARRLVLGNHVGLMFDPYDPQSIAAAINSMIGELSLANDFRTNTRIALDKLNAEQEWQKIVALYDNLPRQNINEERSVLLGGQGHLWRGTHATKIEIACPSSSSKNSSKSIVDRMGSLATTQRTKNYTTICPQGIE